MAGSNAARGPLAKALLLLLAQCGSRSGLDERAGVAVTTIARLGADGTPPLVLPRRCVDDWQTLYESSDSLAPALAIAGDEVLFGEIDVDRESAVLAAVGVAARAGEHRVISSGVFSELWVEGDDVLFWQAARLYRTTLWGGQRMLELDARTAGAETQASSVLVELDALYWTQLSEDAARIGLWRRARDPGAEPEHLAWLESITPKPDGLAVGDGRVVVGGDPSAAVAIESGAVTVLDAVVDGTFAGVDRQGAYSWRPANRTRRGGRALEFEIRRAPADGSETVRLWQGPAGQFLGALWPYGTGWLATGRYYQDDGRPHAVIVYIDSAGQDHPLACAPDADTNIVSRPLLSDGSLYLISATRGVSAVVAIPLAASAPM